MALIELGDPRLDGPPVPPRRRAARHLGVAAAVVLCVLTLAAGAPPGPSRLVRQLWTVPFAPGDMFAMTAGTVDTVSARGALRAYDARSGALRWSRELPDPPQALIPAPAADVVLLPSGSLSPGEGAPAPDYRATAAVDAGTGADLWRQAGQVGAATARGVVLTTKDAAGEVRGLRLVAVRTGATVWARPAPGVLDWTTTGTEQDTPDRVVVLTGDGWVQVLRLADGAGVAAGRVTAASPGDGTTTLLADHDRIYLRRLAAGTVTAYAVDTLDPLWQAPLAADGWLYPCGPVLCAFEDDGVTGIDAATGAARWHRAGELRARPFVPGRLITTGGPGPAAQRLLDAATGRVVAELGDGLLVPDEAGGAAYRLRATLAPTDRIAVTRVDLATGRQTLLGTVPPITGDYGCQAYGHRLACTTTGGRLTVTALG
jgi:PQQ-like domain